MDRSDPVKREFPFANSQCHPRNCPARTCRAGAARGFPFSNRAGFVAFFNGAGNSKRTSSDVLLRRQFCWVTLRACAAYITSGVTIRPFGPRRTSKTPEHTDTMKIRLLASLFAIVAAGCALPPSADPSTVESACAQQCSSNLATCSSGFKFFPIVQQKQCNDNYDVCIKGCPARTSDTSGSKPVAHSAAERLKKLDELLRSGAISKDEYDVKRKEIIGSL